MNRIDQIFTDLRSRDARALMPFVTAGDPDIETTGKLLPAIERAGASICEIGFPFSDPIADGPVIQASMTHALDQGLRPGQVLEMVAEQRDKLSMGLVAMVSYSIVYRIGLEAFVKDAAQAGIDGFIFPDLTLEECEPAREVVASHDIGFTLLISPTTPQARAQKIAAACRGFVYALARVGITGESTDVAASLSDHVARLRQATDLPIAVGFGVSKPEHVRAVVGSADAAIVGSAIMRRVAEHRENPEKLVSQVESLVRELAGGLAPAQSAS